MWTLHMLHPYCSTSHPKLVALKMRQPPLPWEGFPQDFGSWLQGFGSIQPQEHKWGQVSMLGLAQTCCPSSSQRCWTGLRSGIGADQLGSSTPNWATFCFNLPGFVKQEMAKISLCAVALRFIWNKSNENCSQVWGGRNLRDRGLL